MACLFRSQPSQALVASADAQSALRGLFLGLGAVALRAFDQHLEYGLAVEERLGSQSLASALTGAEQFVRGAGRHGAATSAAQAA